MTATAARLADPSSEWLVVATSGVTTLATVHVSKQARDIERQVAEECGFTVRVVDLRGLDAGARAKLLEGVRRG